MVITEQFVIRAPSGGASLENGTSPGVHAFVKASAPRLPAVSAVSVSSVGEVLLRKTEKNQAFVQVQRISVQLVQRKYSSAEMPGVIFWGVFKLPQGGFSPDRLGFHPFRESCLACPSSCRPGSGPGPCGQSPGSDPGGRSPSGCSGRPWPCVYQPSRLSWSANTAQRQAG